MKINVSSLLSIALVIIILLVNVCTVRSAPEQLQDLDYDGSDGSPAGSSAAGRSSSPLRMPYRYGKRGDIINNSNNNNNPDNYNRLIYLKSMIADRERQLSRALDDLMDQLLGQLRVNCTPKGLNNGYNNSNHDITASGGGGGGGGRLPHETAPNFGSPYGTVGGGQAYAGSPGHQSILDSHANSGVNALIYVGVVLLLYVIFMSFIMIRYVMMKSRCKSNNMANTPYYFGGGTGRYMGGTTTTTTAGTTLGAPSVSGYQAAGGNGGGGCGGGIGEPPSVCIDDGGDETPPEIRFIETEL
ncbi:uncharacterized protein LOC128955204 [Oppia nitens]|uniref:uncharacterized protein LOC128955204 n=1 Tax=Oppia nitens TaxID=1686743 RepID=UPI0023DCB1D3|nr:uncharacterized protein LOC128955204 [Oppia nitens]